jgi:hypothetical protein
VVFNIIGVCLPVLILKRKNKIYMLKSGDLANLYDLLDMIALV